MAEKRGFSRKSELDVIPNRMRFNKIKKANFAKLLQQKQIGPNGRSKEWLELAQSEDLLHVLEEKGSSEYFKQLKEKLAEKGFYKEFLD